MNKNELKNSAYTHELELRRRDESPLFTAMYLHEVFNFFEEIVCRPMIHKGEEFTIHIKDIQAGGKFEKFAGYSIKRFVNEFDCLIYLG